MPGEGRRGCRRVITTTTESSLMSHPTTEDIVNEIQKVLDETPRGYIRGQEVQTAGYCGEGRGLVEFASPK